MDYQMLQREVRRSSVMVDAVDLRFELLFSSDLTPLKSTCSLMITNTLIGQIQP